MPYITEKQFDDQLDLPISLPLTEIEPADWIILTTNRITNPQQFTFRWLELQLVSISGVTTPLVTVGRGLVYVALFKNFPPLSSPGGQVPVGNFATDLIQISAVGVAQRSPTTSLVVTEPPATSDVYNFVIANNTVNATLRVSVNGSVRMQLNP